MLPCGLTVDNGDGTVFLRALSLALRLHGFTHWTRKSFPQNIHVVSN
jgi:hypothetical protein